MLEHVELDDARVPEQPFCRRGEAEVVERDREALRDEVCQHVEQRVVDDLILEQLEHDAPGRQRRRAHAQQKVTRDVHIGDVLADEIEQADIEEPIENHRRGRRAVVEDARGLAVRFAKQQLIADQASISVQDRLPCHRYRGAPGRRRSGPTAGDRLCLPPAMGQHTKLSTYPDASFSWRTSTLDSGDSGARSLRPRAARRG